ncbi:serine protease 44-like [Rhopilema esculentum]|uniref:serine protease 44-like n=1 Tax=Rhopilema esculentum TaxID=499914 RepID=UPI0031D0DB2E|eukprot:gene17404-9004_t
MAHLHLLGQGTRIIREHQSRSTINDLETHCGDTLTIVPPKPGEKKLIMLENEEKIFERQETVELKKLKPRNISIVLQPCHKDREKTSTRGSKHLFDCGEGKHDNDADWHVLLWRKDETMYICHGALVHKQWVLTVAHCLVSYDGSYFKPGQLLVRFRKARTKVAVDKVVVHEHFVYKTFRNDIALLRLAKPVENKQTVCLPTTSMLSNLQGLSYRWIEGDIFDENLSGELKEHIFNHRRSKNCDAQVKKEAISYHYGDKNVCSVNPCKGDIWEQLSDGSPVIKKQSSTHTLLAVKTWGSSALSCYVGGGVDVHIDLSKYTKWIAGIIGDK